MTADLCPHGDIAAACLDCLDGKPPERPAPKALRVFEAMYRGTCDRCRDPIEPGEEIALMDDDSYVHAEHLPRGGRP
jgi:hypothetical protein